ncbi:MAG: 16S rRNA (uracil(1498)-N(3))-methyltransferase [Pseudomonadota bacterium]|nr:16S rRNA (uracil(1498)-N(3))-methyltransferase [Pseudomonadota bacterium]
MSNIRIYIDKEITEGFVTLDKDQSHYIKNVMRLKAGDMFNIFNENDGEWRVRLEEIKKNESVVNAEECLGIKPEPADVWVLFAPVKKLRTDYISQKITELGAQLIWPIITERTQFKKIKSSKILSNAIEAAEQCGMTFIPKVNKSKNLDYILDNWKNIADDRFLIFCDEDFSGDPVKLLKGAKKKNKENKWAILIGPEGGFSETERNKIMKLEKSFNISLGPRILRSDTAIVSALTIFHSTLGDWV